MIARYEPAIIILWTMATAAVSFADLQHPVRTALALVFLGFVPGLAVIRLSRLQGLGIRLLLALPSSLAIAAVVSAALVYSGFPSWDLGLSALLSITVGAVALDLARPIVFAERTGQPRRKLDDESRQAALIQTLLDGGTLAEAAKAAGVSTATLQRALHRSNALWTAVSVATHHESQAELDDSRAPLDPRRSLRR
jgi:hypothetical protein